MSGLALNWEIVFVFGLLGCTLLSFLLERISTDLTALCAMAALIAVSAFSKSSHLPSVSELFSIFSSPAPITIAGMFVVSAALEKCGGIEMMSEILGTLTSKGYAFFMAVLILIVATFSAFINNTPVVVVLLPVVLNLSKRLQVPASKLLIPVSYASILGGCCTLMGTSTNILASGVIQAYGYEPFSMFELSQVGLPILGLGSIYLVLFSKKLLPVRETVSSILSEDARKEYITEAFIHKNSPLVGQALDQTDLFAKKKGIRVLEIIRGGQSLDEPLGSIVLEKRDRIVLACRPSGLVQARDLKGVDLVTEKGLLGLESIGPTQTGIIVEGMIGPTSRMIGQSIKDFNFKQLYHVLILAIHRKGRNLQNDLNTLRLTAGDTLLLMGTEVQIEKLRSGSDIIMLDRPPIKAENLRRKMPLVAGIIALIVLLATFDIMPIMGGVIVGVALLIVAGCVSIKEAYGSVEWGILVLIYGMLSIGMAMEKSGSSLLIANSLAQFVERFCPPDLQPIVMLSGLFIVTWILTEILSNNATVVLMEPIAISVATTLALNTRPFIIAACIAASCTFSTPIGYQTNTYVYGVGGYRFKDFFKIGIPLNILVILLSIALIPKIWPF